MDIPSALASMKTLGDLVTLALKIKQDTALEKKAIESRQAIISLNTTIFSVQAQNQELLEENKQLKQQLIDAKKWDTEKGKYELRKVGGSGCFAYVLKSEYSATTPEHWICTNCYEQHRKSILQPTSTRRLNGCIDQ